MQQQQLKTARLEASYNRAVFGIIAQQDTGLKERNFESLANQQYLNTVKSGLPATSIALFHGCEFSCLCINIAFLLIRTIQDHQTTNSKNISKFCFNFNTVFQIPATSHTAHC